MDTLNWRCEIATGTRMDACFWMLVQRKKEGEKKREIEKGWFKSAEETTRAIRFLMGIVLFPQKSI